MFGLDQPSSRFGPAGNELLALPALMALLLGHGLKESPAEACRQANRQLLSLHSIPITQSSLIMVPCDACMAPLNETDLQGPQEMAEVMSAVQPRQNLLENFNAHSEGKVSLQSSAKPPRCLTLPSWWALNFSSAFWRGCKALSPMSVPVVPAPSLPTSCSQLLSDSQFSCSFQKFTTEIRYRTRAADIIYHTTSNNKESSYS